MLDKDSNLVFKNINRTRSEGKNFLVKLFAIMELHKICNDYIFSALTVAQYYGDKHSGPIEDPLPALRRCLISNN